MLPTSNTSIASNFRMKQSCSSSTSLLLFFALVALIDSAVVEARNAIPAGNKDGINNLPNEAGDHSGSRRNSAILTWNDFTRRGGTGAAECAGKFYSDSKHVVALSTRWYAGGKRCHKKIKIYGNGRKTEARVVDECDTPRDHCKPNIVDGSKAVWKALGVNPSDPRFGMMKVTWSDA